MNNSHEATQTRRDKEELSGIVVDCGYHLHRELGSGNPETFHYWHQAQNILKG